jgi:hypothetical protein
MQTDGNLVIYDDKPLPLWATHTSQAADFSYLRVQDDGNLVLYQPNGQPVWASNTVQ